MTSGTKAFDGYGWMHWLGGAYCIAVGIGSVVAYVADGLWLQAIICAGAQAIGICFMVMAVRASRSGAPVTAFIEASAGIACCSVAAMGIQHAWMQTGGDLPYFAAWFIAAVEPVLFVCADHTEAKQREAARKLALAHEAEEAEEAMRRRREELRLEADASRHWRETAPRAHDPKPHRLARGIAAGAATLSLIASPATANEDPVREPNARTSTIDATRPKPYDAGIVQAWLIAKSRDPNLSQIAYIERATISRATLQRHLKRWADAGQPQLMAG